MFLSIAILDSFTLVLSGVLTISILGLGLVVYNQFIHPILSRKDSDRFIPVQTGDKYDLVVDELSRFASFQVGSKTGQLATRCNAITEDHLIFQFKKSRDSEDYTITVLKNGPTFYKPPRMEHYGKMESKESFESYEIIGHPAEFRISDKITKERMVNFIEVSLTSSFYFNRSGKERMKFTFEVGKIQPGINRKVRFRGDVYGFGKEEGAEED
ncbi:hypothetical protein EHQ24_06345 [Leptospira noumeaensis]|uniref:Uncharacterized protein n=1 Tax=Leptospira noumeaensis TaxID=2484964 RepID=A0A4R9IDP4_9LEPT|nr:hypothetical protein [Leptospira noumeaensis]TGK84607.1 hypothetical protein EHQ24_06345 [Leptospira noumeaensis]